MTDIPVRLLQPNFTTSETSPVKQTARHMEITYDDRTGQIQSLVDTRSGREVISFAPGHEFEVNHRPLSVEVMKHKPFWGGIMTRFDVRSMDCYLAGARYELQRVVVPRASGNDGGNGDSVHIRHTLRRKEWGDWEDPLDDLWEHPIESPELIKTMSVLCASTPFFGEKTHMRAIAIGGSGPREHVSLEDGPIAEVMPWLQTRFRNTFPGQSTVPGALYYDPEDERWLWIVTHHPYIGGDVGFSEDGIRFNFHPFQQMSMHDRFVLPDISIYYGQGMDEADKVMATLFDLYEEPPEWWYKTTWFWLHPLFQKNANYENMQKAVDILMDECGVNGFGLILHHLSPAGADCECHSPKSSPILGGDDRLKPVLKRIREKGGHTYAWMARYGRIAAGGPQTWQNDWALRGIDTRPVGHEVFRICDSHSPDWRAFLRKWVEYYVRYLGVDGIFWDSAFQPMVPNFSDASNSWLNCPGEAMAGGPSFYEEIYRFGKDLHEDFFMWGEGITTECMMNAFAVDNRTHGDRSGHALMHRIAHAGPRRLVWRSAWPHDVSGAFPFLKPVNDVGRDLASDFYEEVASDPMNQWVCKTVKERGCRQARGIADGIAVLDEFIVVSPDEKLLGPVTVPGDLARGSSLIHVISGEKLEGVNADDGVRFDLTATGAWRMA